MIGNATQIKASLFQPAGTLAGGRLPSSERLPGLAQASLIYLAAILLVISLIVNLVARTYVRRTRMTVAR